MPDTHASCPICADKVEDDGILCHQCGWDLTPVLGTDSNVLEQYLEKIKIAKAIWQSKQEPKKTARLITKEAPVLEQDPFETDEEWEQRLIQPIYLAGKVELLKSKYDIKNGIFPLQMIESQLWLKQFLNRKKILLGNLHIHLNRDESKELYQRGKIWSLGISLKVVLEKLAIDSLFLLDGLDNNHLLIQWENTTHGGYFVDNEDGTVTDTRTELTWMRCVLGEHWDIESSKCKGEPTKYLYKFAAKYAEQFNNDGGAGGYNDWRIPTLDELKSLIVEKGKPAIDTEAFPSQSLIPSGILGRIWHKCWSSSKFKDEDQWFICFKSGKQNYAGAGLLRYIRLVRSEK